MRSRQGRAGEPHDHQAGSGLGRPHRGSRRPHVDALMREAERAGAVITDPARDRIDHAHGIVSGFGRTAAADLLLREVVEGRDESRAELLSTLDSQPSTRGSVPFGCGGAALCGGPCGDGGGAWARPRLRRLLHSGVAHEGEHRPVGRPRRHVDRALPAVEVRDHSRRAALDRHQAQSDRLMPRRQSFCESTGRAGGLLLSRPEGGDDRRSRAPERSSRRAARRLHV